MKALAIDLGGSHATCAVVDDRKILASEVISCDGATGIGAVLPEFASSLRDSLAKLGLTAADCGGVAFGFCALADARTSRIVSTNKKYEDATSIDFPAWSQKEFGLPIRMENDARLALIGEHYAGAGRGYNDVMMFTLGTGIGGAAMIGGVALRGKHSQAGCLGGHISASFDGPPCTCGAIGCTEAEAAGWSIPLIAKEWPGYAESALGKDEPVTFKKLFTYAAQGDAVAVALRDRCLKVWATAAVGAVHAYDPEIIVYGGGVMKSADVILPFIQEYVAKHAWTPWGKVKVVAAELGNDAGLLGAVPLLSEKF